MLFRNIDLMRICLVAGCFLSAVEGQCLQSRCVAYTIEEQTATLSTECSGDSCSDAFTCPGLDACITEQSLDACEECINAVEDFGANATDSCGDGRICLSFSSQAVLSVIQSAAGSVDITASDIDPCCQLPDIGDCFSSMATADVENKGKALVKDIEIGDKVLTKDGEYKPVYTMDHKNSKKLTKFVQIYSTANAESPLEMTNNHMVFIHGRESPIPASAVKVGDALQTVNVDSPSMVTKISSIERKGIWNPITADSTIVVDGIVASTHSVPFRANDEADVEVAGMKVMSHHDFIHLLSTPHRAMCLGWSFSFCETNNNEFNAFSHLGNQILKVFYNQSEVVQDFMIFVALQIAYVFKLLSLVLNPIFVLGLALGTGTYIVCTKKN
jgi:hypothetical protein